MQCAYLLLLCSVQYSLLLDVLFVLALIFFLANNLLIGDSLRTDWLLLNFHFFLLRVLLIKIAFEIFE